MRTSGFGSGAVRISDDEFAETLLGASIYVKDNLLATEALIRQCVGDGSKKLSLHITEHGPLVWGFDPAHAQEDSLWNRSLAGALYQACLFNVVLRDPLVTSANHLPLCQDYYGALVGIHVAGSNRQSWRTWRNVVFYVFQEYSKLAGRQVLATQVSCPVYSPGMAGIVPAQVGVPSLDAAAFRSPDGNKMSLFLINRDVKRDAVAQIQVPRMHAVSVTNLSADSYLAVNSPENPNLVRPVLQPTKALVPGSAIRVPRHSLTVVEFRAK